MAESASEIGLTRSWARRSVAKIGRKMGRFRSYRCGWADRRWYSDKKTLHNVGNRRDRCTTVPFSKSKGDSGLLLNKLRTDLFEGYKHWDSNDFKKGKREHSYQIQQSITEVLAW